MSDIPLLILQLSTLGMIGVAVYAIAYLVRNPLPKEEKKAQPK